MNRTYLATIVAAALSSSAWAQAPSGQWNGSVSIGASFAQSHADVRNTNFSVAADASRATAADKIALYASALYGNSKLDGVGGDTANNLKFGGRYEWNLSAQAYAFAGLDFERDTVSVPELELRTALSVGAGYYFVKSDPLTLTVFAGIGYRKDKYSVGSYDATELLIGEESVHKISNDVSFKQRLVLYPNLSDSGDLRAAFDATLSVKLSGAWNLNLSLVDRYNNQVGPNKNDIGFFVGVGAKFGK
jgi:putative salt-induced outer membrane protein YdiY